MSTTKVKEKEDEIIKEIATTFKNIVKEPEQFLTVQPKKCKSICTLLQQTYGVATSNDAVNCDRADMLPELIVEDMDEEQIWQQLELRNDLVLKQYVEKTAKILAMREERFEIRLREDGAEEEEDEGSLNEKEEKADDNELRDSEEEQDEEEDEEEDLFQETKKKNKQKFRKTVVDDKFFKLGEMEAYLEAEDAKEMRKQKQKRAADDDDGIDYFAEHLGDSEQDDELDDDDDGEEQNEGNANYKDFFDDDVDEDENNDIKARKGQEESDDGVTEGKDHFAEESEEEAQAVREEFEDEEAGKEEQIEDENVVNDESDSDEEHSESEAIKANKKQKPFPANAQTDSEDDSEDERNEKQDEEQPKSSFQVRQERLQQRIRDYEDEVLGEKPWQLKGEVVGGNRPQNSLLEEILEFESTVRPAPIITEETTRCLEDIIKQRIKDQAWDDVERVVRAVKTPQDYRKQLVLDQEKSKESLAQVYEKEYQRELDKLDPSRADGSTGEEPKEHKEIRNMMRTLFIKLDALSNFHFTPKPIAPEIKIITNTPAVAMEEVAPVAVSDAKLLAPEEVYRGPKNGLLGKSERSRTDKNRERRKKKQKQRAIHNALEVKDIQRQKMGIPLTKKEESAKILKSITKHRNVEKMTASNDQGSLKSSKAFFSKLQDTTTATKGDNAKSAKRKPDAKMHTAKKLKL